MPIISGIVKLLLSWPSTHCRLANEKLCWKVLKVLNMSLHGFLLGQWHCPLRHPTDTRWMIEPPMVIPNHKKPWITADGLNDFSRWG